MIMALILIRLFSSLDLPAPSWQRRRYRYVPCLRWLRHRGTLAVWFFLGKVEQNMTTWITPDAPCMEYLPTFTPKIAQM